MEATKPEVTSENFPEVYLRGKWSIKIQGIGTGEVMFQKELALQYCVTALAGLTRKPVFVSDTKTFFQFISFDAEKNELEVKVNK